MLFQNSVSYLSTLHRSGKFFYLDAVEDDSWDLNGTADMNTRGMEDSVDDDEDTERLLQEQLQAELGKGVGVDNSRKKRKRHAGQSSGRGPRSDTIAPKHKADRSEAEATAAAESEVEETQASGVPVKIMAERRDPDEIQLLVKWKNYPEEKDWTWKSQSELRGTVPKLVKSWRAKKDEKDSETEVILEDIVEKILGKRKWKGVPHYLVKWKGYEEIEDRTWEPCARLKVDVPEMVDAYESKAKKKLKK